MSKPTLLYPVTLVQNGTSTPSVAPSVGALPVIANEQLFAILEQDVGEQDQGFYVFNEDRWQFAIPYPAISAGVIFAEYIDVLINPAAPVTYEAGSTIYRNGVLLNTLTVPIDGNAVYAVMKPANKVIEPYVLPPATETTLGGVIVPAGSKIVVAPNGSIDVDPALVADINSKVEDVVTSGTGTSVIRQVVAGVVTLKSLKATTGVVLNDDGAGTLTFSGVAATVSTLGMIKVGSGLAIAGDGTLSATGMTSVTLTGDVTGTGTGTVPTTLSNTGVAAGTYTKVTVDTKGRVTIGAQLNASDVINGLGYTPYNATNPAGYISANQPITINGDASGTGTTTIALVLASVGTAGTYTKVTTDAKGRVISGQNPTTLAGYGIVDAVNKAGDTMNGDLLFSGAFTVKVPTPVAGVDAANRDYVDQAISSVASGASWKANVVAATTGNIVLSGTQVVDGVSVLAGNRVLVKDQTDAKQNGIYVVVAGGPWTRATDADLGTEIQGAAVLALGGTVNSLTQWINTNGTPPVIGTDNITFTRFQGGGLTYTAGTGLGLLNEQFYIADTGVVAGDYTKVTVNAQGQVTAGSNPTTLAGYGITDAATKAQVEARAGASTSIFNGGVLSINTDTTKFDVSGGTALFMDYTDPQNPVGSSMNFGPFPAVTVTNIATQPVTYVGINSAASIVQQAGPFTASQRRSIAPIGLVIHSNNVVVNAVNQTTPLNRSTLNQLQDLFEAIGALNVMGNVYSANGANLNLNKSAGTLLRYGSNAANNVLDPHQVQLPQQSALTFRYRQANSAESANTTAINPGLYDNAGTLTAVNPAQFTIQRIFVFQSGLTRIQYGQATYTSLDAALGSINTENFTVESNIFSNGVSRGLLIVKGNATDLTDPAQARFLEVPKFGLANGGSGGSTVTAADIIAALGYTPVAQSGDTMTGALNWAATVNVASAATTDIGGAASNAINITGTTTVTALGTATAGAERWVTFTGALTLTHNASSLILPTGANILTVAGDSAVFMSLGAGNWRCVAYTRADGTALVGAPDPTKLPLDGGTMSGAINYAPTDTVVAAGTTQIGNAVSNTVTITGTATINFFTNVASGFTRKVIFASAGSTLVNSASMILPGGANITTLAGDTAEFVSQGGAVWKCLTYTRASGVALVADNDTTKVAKTGGTTDALMTGSFNEALGVALAATAGTGTNIGAVAGNTIFLSGTSGTLTGFTGGVGGMIRRIRFVSAGLVLQASATFVIPGGGPITAASGDWCELYYHNANSAWYMISYTKADGTPLVAPSASDPTKLPLAGGTMTGPITMGNGTANINFTSPASLNYAARAGQAAPSSEGSYDAGTKGNVIWFVTTGIINLFTGGADGMTRKFYVQPGQTVTIRNNANIVLPGGADIVAVGGDSFEMLCLGGSPNTWKMLSFQRATGLPLVADSNKVNKAGDTMTGALNMAAKVSMVAADPTNITSAASNDVDITNGVTTINSFGAGNNGQHRKLTFTGTNAITLVNSSSIVLPSGANVVTATGDCAEFVCLGGSTWKCLWYTKANGTALVGTSAPDPTKLPLAGGKMTGAIDLANYVNLAAASTTNIASSASNNYSIIAGTTTINSLGSGSEGAHRSVTFTVAGITLVHGTTTIELPSAANIVTAVGDYAEFVCRGGTNWKCVVYTKANGQSIVGAPDTTKLPLAGGTMSGAINYAPAAAKVAAASVDIGTSTSNDITISGNTTITSFAGGTDGMTRKLVFTGTPLLTHNATTFILPGAANIQVATGDTAEFVCNGGATSWRCLWYTRADGTSVKPASGTLQGALNTAGPVSLASASNVAIGAAASNNVTITGTTTITGFDSIAAGATRTLTFSGVLTLTHGSPTLVLPGAASITTAAGDTAEFVSTGFGNWKCLWYQRANGQAIVGAPDATKLPLAGGTMSGAINYAPTVSVGAGASMNLGGQNANSVTITGTGVDIAALGTAAAGITRDVTFASATGNLVHNATSLILPTAADIAIAAGDTASFLSLGSGNWKCMWYARASGQALIGAPDATKLPLAGGTMTGAFNEATAVTIAAASSITVGSAAANTIKITGSTPISTLAGGAAGMIRRLHFQAAGTLSTGGNMVLPAGQNVSYAIDDIAEFVFSAGDTLWYMTNFWRANGQPLYGGTGQTAYAVGDMLYANSTTSLAKVSGNTSTARQFLMQQGNGSTMTSIGFSAVGQADVTNLTTDLAAKAAKANFPNGPGAIAAYDLRTITNPATDIGYSSGLRARFGTMSDVAANSDYADVIDLSTYQDVTGGAINALYFGKTGGLAGMQIQHKFMLAGGSAWDRVKTLAYTDDPSMGGYLSKSVAGGVDVTLTAAEAKYNTIQFTGALTANINVIMPQTAAQWVIYNATTGAFTLTVKTSISPGVVVKQSNTNQLFCNGSQIVRSRTDFDNIGNVTCTTLTASGNIAGGGLYAGQSTAQAGGNGQLRYYKDTGVIAWTTGVDGSAGGVNYILYDNVGGATRQTVAPDGTATFLVAGTQRAQIHSTGSTFTGVVTIPTATQFDSSTTAASTAFVQTALGNLSSATAVASGSTLAASTAGKLVGLTGSSGTAFTLPLLSSLPTGAAITYINNNNNGGATTVTAQGSDLISSVNTGGAATFTVPLGTFAVFIKQSAAFWYVYGTSVPATSSVLNSPTITGTAAMATVPNYGPGPGTLPNTLNDRWNPVANPNIGGTCIWPDEEFGQGLNGITVYNNGTGSVTVTRMADSNAPNATGQIVRWSYDGTGAPNPGNGGWLQQYTQGLNDIIVQRIRAKVPVGYTLINAENSAGTNATIYWLTSQAGTGKYEDYIRVAHCGDSGSFNVGGHIYVAGPAAAINVDIASQTAFNVTARQQTWGSRVSRLWADYSNATHSLRSMFQTNVVNGATVVAGIPNGSGTTTNFNGYNSSDADNAAIVQLGINTTAAYLTTSSTGLGVALPLAFNIAGVERMRIDTNGNVGIGVVPSAWANTATFKPLQINTGCGLMADSANFYMISNAYWNGTNYTRQTTNPVSQFSSETGAFVWRQAASGTAGTTTALTEAMRIDINGNLLVGVSSGATHYINRASAAEGNSLLLVTSGAGSSSVIMSMGSGTGMNAGATVLGVQKNSGTNRSINAAGTINASGADYAEYMRKAFGCGLFAKGAIVGINSEGLLTDKWADAVSFLIKSTDPSYVGGDTWGSEEALGIVRPLEIQFEAPAYDGVEQPGVEPTAPTEPAEDAGEAEVEAYEKEFAAYQQVKAKYDAAKAAYDEDRAAYEDLVAEQRRIYDTVTFPSHQKAVAEFEAALEDARQHVDRIAFCGQVPVNVVGAEVGQYVVPVQDGEGIGYKLVNEDDMTLKQYMKAVGVVQNILPDGRANVRVKPV